MQNVEVARAFQKYADLLEIQGANPFRVRAYRSAATTVEGLSSAVQDMVEQGEDLTEIHGIGEDLAGKIETLVTTGELPELKELERKVPKELSELMTLDQLGPKRTKIIHDELKIKTLDELREAAEAGKISELEGFGKKTEQKILDELGKVPERSQRTRLGEAEQAALPLADYLRELKEVKDVVIAGSFRRRKETVGDLDILVTCDNSDPVMKRFTGYSEVDTVVSQGTTKSTVHLKSGLQVDLRVVPEESYGAALHYFTGSKGHNVAIRKMIVDQGLKLNEYGIFKGDKRIAGETETEVFKQVNLPYIPPELRENQGEIEAAQKNRLPRLVELDDIRGDLHMHTKTTDGRNTVREMAEAARELGYEYIAITDHSQALPMAKGLDPKRLRKQLENIDEVNRDIKGIEILKSIEVDILEDGRLDLPDEVLKELDLTVCSVHSKFSLSRKQQTERILRAMDNRYFKILGHPTGRLINEREGLQIDMEKIVEAAKEHGCCMELNAQPSRMDLAGPYARMVKEAGVLGVVSTDSHAVDHLRFMHLGVDQARRGWMEKDDILNTRSLGQLKKILRR